MPRRWPPQAGLKRAKNIPGIETVEPDVGVAWMPAFVAGAVECDGWLSAPQTHDERIPPPFRPTSFLRRLRTSREVGCRRHTDAQRDRKRSGAQSLLLPAAIDQPATARTRLCSIADAKIRLRSAGGRRAKQRQIVGFRGPGREDDLVGVSTDQRRDRFRRFPHRLVRLPTDRVIDRMRIAERFAPIRCHPVHNARVERRGRLIIGVYRTITVVIPVEETSSWLPCSGSSVASSRISPGGEGRASGNRATGRSSIASMSALLYRSASPGTPGSSRFRALGPASGWPRSRTRLSPVKSSSASAGRLSSRSSSLRSS